MLKKPGVVSCLLRFIGATYDDIGLSIKGLHRADLQQDTITLGIRRRGRLKFQSTDSSFERLESGDPLDFMARLAALVPRLRLNLTRFHGVFVPNF